jgi:hypothetical protein
MPGTSWMWVLLWTLAIGPLVMFVLLALFLKLLSSVFNQQFNRENNGTVLFTLFWVWIVMFALATCTPYAWAHSRLIAAQRLTMPSKLARYNCWQNGTSTTPIDPRVTEFVFLEEPNWYVDYTSADAQKISGSTDDDGNAETWCVAPIKYRGAVPCTSTKFFALCYAGKSSSCNAANAELCGWDQPSNGVILRVINENEFFFPAIALDDPEDKKQVDLAVYRAIGARSSPIGFVPVIYGGSTPEEISATIPDATDTTNLLRGVIYGCHFTLSLLFAVKLAFNLRTED